MKIYIGLNGEGLGHYSRAVAIYGEAIKQGHEAVMATYGTAYQKAVSENVKVIEVLQEIAMAGQGGDFVLGKTILASLGFPRRFYKAYKQERELIKNYDVVVSDCRVASILAAHKLHKPVFLVCNQTTTPKLPVKETGNLLRDVQRKIKARLVERLMTISCMVQYHWADKIMIGDFQPPHTITQPLISQRPSVVGRTSIVGPLNRLVDGYEEKSWEELGFRNNKPKIFMTIGGQGFRMGMIPKLLTVVKKLDANVLFSHFSVEKETFEGNLLMRPFSKAIYAYMATADLVVVPAGHSGIMELLIMEIPGVLMPDGGQPEQISNSIQFQKLGLGEYVLHEEVDQLENKIKNVLNNLSFYKNRFNGLNQLAQTTDHGPKNALQKITETYKEHYLK
jgi:UDP-N-acetylglucosamine--N-acetylmuramyl-(pentapeptide) pyrophosphoryl-undecaprenol N-acetylglucosamine transferase